MTGYRTLFTFYLLLSMCQVSALDDSPIGKVLQLLDGLTGKITKEAEAEEKIFTEFMEWCDDAKTETGFEIKTATSDKEKLEASIIKSTSDIEVSVSGLDDLAKSISGSEADLSSATEIRRKEHTDFAAIESDLVDTIDTLDRAVAILGREMQKNPALLQQTVSSANFKQVIKVLDTVVDAAGLASNDKHKLLALVQDRQADEDGDDDFGAPSGSKYESHSTSIIDVLEDLKEKAEGQLADSRKAEASASHNFAMLKQSLEDELASDNKAMTKTKTNKASFEESKAVAEGDLQMTVKSLMGSQAKLEMATNDCTMAASDHKASVASRTEELKAIATATKLIKSTTGGAEGQVYFLQKGSSAVRSSLRTGTDLIKFEIVAMLKQLARKQHSAALAQLASRVQSVVRYSAASGEDPFAKVKELISGLIASLEKDAAGEATHKAYCDEEMSKSKTKKDELSSDADRLTAKIDKAVASSTTLKGQVAEFQKELAMISKTQAEMDSIRADEHSAFVQAEADLKQGIEGVQRALEVLREYYGSGSALLQDDSQMTNMMQQPAMPSMHAGAQGAGSSIIGMLEVCESDFSKSLAEETVAEDEAATEYTKLTQENKISKTTKEQDVKYKTSEAKGLDKSISEFSSDREGLQTELAAVLEYSDKLVKQCTYSADPYEERKARREAEIAGLKEAMKYLAGDAALLQRRGGAHGLRGVRAQ